MTANSYIHDVIVWNNQFITLNDKAVITLSGETITDYAVAAFRTLDTPYPKFFKMDILSKVVYTAVAMLVKEGHINADWLNDTATCITTTHGCLDVDEKFEQSRSALASPALFVYTLPNIMLGEICIKHQFKGEQLCTIGGVNEALALYDYISLLLAENHAKQAIIGYADAYNDKINVQLAFISQQESSLPFEMDTYKKILSL